MTTASLVFIRKALGKPAIAFLVDQEGRWVLSASHPGPEYWFFQPDIDSERFRHLALNKEVVTVGMAIVPSPYAVPVLVIAHQLGNWEHRLLVPLVGDTVRRHLESLLSASVGPRVTFGDERSDIGLSLVTQACPEMLENALRHCVEHTYRTEHVSGVLDVLGAQYRAPEHFSPNPAHGKVGHVQVSVVLIPELQNRP